jgi:hypothetical protein
LAEQFRLYDWDFCVDSKKTKEFYKNNSTKFTSVKSGPRDLQESLNSLGVDSRKPVIISSDRFEAVFVVYGTASSVTGFEIDFKDEQYYLSIVVLPNYDCDLDIKGEPVFSIGIEFFKVLLAENYSEEQ